MLQKTQQKESLLEYATAISDVELQPVKGTTAILAQLDREEMTLGGRRREGQGWKGRQIEEKLGMPTMTAVATAVMKRRRRQCSTLRSRWRDESCLPVLVELQLGDLSSYIWRKEE